MTTGRHFHRSGGGSQAAVLNLRSDRYNTLAKGVWECEVVRKRKTTLEGDINSS